MRQRIIRLISIAAVMAGIIVVAEYTNPIAEEPETVDMLLSVGREAADEISESVRSEETENREEAVQEGIQEKEIRGKVIQKEEILKERYQKTAGGIFIEDSAVVDLGNHKVAYLTNSNELERSYSYKEWVVIQRLDKGVLYSSEWDTLFIPTEGVVTEIESVDGFTGLRIQEKIGQEVRDRRIPICFFPEADFIDLYRSCNRVIPSIQSERISLPVEVWTETIGSGDEKYEISFERIGIPYKLVTDFKGGDFADYRLTVRDGEGKEVQKLILTCVYVSQEDTHWMIDIDRDGFSDLIFCADHLVGQRETSTELIFLIWNNDNKSYEEKAFNPNTAIRTYFERPVWNTKENALMYTTGELGNEWMRGRKMYRFVDGDWRLYAEMIPSSDEEPPRMYGYEEELYYKTLDYYYRERRYESGEMIGETDMEDAPYEDEQSIWYDEREGNEALVPGGEFPGNPFN